MRSLFILLAFAGQAYAETELNADDEKLLHDLLTNADDETVDEFTSKLVDKMTQRALEVEPDLFGDFDESTLAKGGGGGGAPPPKRGRAPPPAPAPAPSGGGPQWLQNLLDSGGGVTPTSGQIPSRGQRALEDAPPRKGGIKIRNPFQKAMNDVDIQAQVRPQMPRMGVQPGMMRTPFAEELDAEDDESPSLATFVAVTVVSFCTGSALTLLVHYLTHRGAKVGAREVPLLS